MAEIGFLSCCDKGNWKMLKRLEKSKKSRVSKGIRKMYKEVAFELIFKGCVGWWKAFQADDRRLKWEERLQSRETTHVRHSENCCMNE